AAALAILLFYRVKSPVTIGLILLCAYVAGIGLNRLDALDLWPWLGRCWKWPTSLNWLHSPREAVVGFGPIAFAGVAAGIIAAAVARQRSFVAFGFAFGYLAQAIIDITTIYRGAVGL